MKQLITLFVGLVLTSYAQARIGIDGGGGMAVVCKTGQGQHVELLDLYEAKALPNIQVMSASGDLFEDYLRLTNNSFRLQRVKMTLPTDEAKIMLTNMLSLIDWHDDSAPIPFTNDQGKTVSLPANCELKQLARYYDSTDRMKVDRNLWNQLDSINQAALLKHESHYWNERQLQETTSESTRSYVRQEASIGFTPILTDAPLTNPRCYAGIGGVDQSLFIPERLKNASSGEDTVFHFKTIAGRFLQVKTTATFQGLKFDVKEGKDSQGETFIYPFAAGINQTLTVKVVTEHRDDWELKLQFISNQPVQLTLLQKGIPISTGALRTCHH